MSEHGVDKIKLLFKSLDSLVEFGEDVYADGKIDMADIAHLSKLMPIGKDLYESYKSFSEMKEEIKDMNWEEFKSLFDEIL